MAEIPIPDGFGVPLVDLSTYLPPLPTVEALEARNDARYATADQGQLAETAYQVPAGAVVLDVATADARYIDPAELSSSLATKADLVGGVVPTSQIPSLALVNAVPAASQAAMLALTAAQVQPGDVAIRSDGAGTFMLVGSNPSVLANWALLNAPTDRVNSVNGQVGTVVLGKADVGLGNVDNTSDANKPVSTAQRAAIDAAAPSRIFVKGTAQSYTPPRSSFSTQLMVGDGLDGLGMWTCTRTGLYLIEGTIRPADGTPTSQYGVKVGVNNGDDPDMVWFPRVYPGGDYRTTFKVNRVMRVNQGEGVRLSAYIEAAADVLITNAALSITSL